MAGACRYPPAGYRSAGGVLAAGEPFCIVMAESAEAVADLEATLAQGGVDGIYVGPRDLSYSLGCPLDPEDPVLRPALERIWAACGAAWEAGGRVRHGRRDRTALPRRRVQPHHGRLGRCGHFPRDGGRARSRPEIAMLFVVGRQAVRPARRAAAAYPAPGETKGPAGRSRRRGSDGPASGDWPVRASRVPRGRGLTLAQRVIAWTMRRASSSN